MCTARYSAHERSSSAPRGQIHPGVNGLNTVYSTWTCLASLLTCLVSHDMIKRSSSRQIELSKQSSTWKPLVVPQCEVSLTRTVLCHRAFCEWLILGKEKKKKYNKSISQFWHGKSLSCITVQVNPRTRTHHCVIYLPWHGVNKARISTPSHSCAVPGLAIWWEKT